MAQNPFLGAEQEFKNVPAAGVQATVTVDPGAQQAVVFSSVSWSASPTAATGAFTGTIDILVGATVVWSLPFNVVAGQLSPVTFSLAALAAFPRGQTVTVRFSGAGNGTLQQGVAASGYFE